MVSPHQSLHMTVNTDGRPNCLPETMPTFRSSFLQHRCLFCPSSTKLYGRTRQRETNPLSGSQYNADLLLLGAAILLRSYSTFLFLSRKSCGCFVEAERFLVVRECTYFHPTYSKCKDGMRRCCYTKQTKERYISVYLYMFGTQNVQFHCKNPFQEIRMKLRLHPSPRQSPKLPTPTPYEEEKAAKSEKRPKIQERQMHRIST